MKILCVCDNLIPQNIQTKYKELERYGAEVEIIDNEDMVQDRDSCMGVMFATEHGGPEAVKCNEKVKEASKDADILIVHMSPVNKAVIDAAKNLKVVGVMRGGLDNINVEYLKEKGITTVHAPLRSAHAVADFTLGMIISEMNNIAKSHHALKEGKWLKEYPNSDNVHDLRTRTVGIIGCGNIGRLVIERLKAFGCKIIVHDPFVSDEDIKGMGYIPVSKETILQEADIITIHLRASEKTQNYIGTKDFKNMKPNCVFVNTARAGVVDQDAMVDTLKQHIISGAAVDVFDEEPLPERNKYRELENLTMTAHIAGTSCDTFVTSVELIYEEIERYLRGEDMVCVVK